jgi:glutamyl-Q tRNA(Asp) synthetase
VSSTAASPAGAPCGRFAPSPTGPLHFGSLVAAVASHADARAAQGRWLVRIEDVDEPRTVPGAANDILASLARHGFSWDAPPARQSASTARYAAALDRLRSAGLVYPCACTRRDLADAPLVDGERVYPGHCRGGITLARAARSQRSWRVAVGEASVQFVDRVQGPQSQVLRDEVGDFVVLRADGYFAYQLAVVVDDAADRVNAVVRGADLLGSTARQIHLQRLLALPTPTYLHVPVAVDRNGQKLSKQQGAPALDGDPVVALRAAWRFLGQDAPPADCATVAAFWSHAVRSWTPARVPRVLAQPAPP